MDIFILETYGSGSGLEPGHLGASGRPLISGDDGLQDLGGDVPELLVVGPEQDDNPVALGVEAAGDVPKRLLDDVLNAISGDRDLLVQAVVSPPGLDEVQDGVGGGWSLRHFGGACCQRTG